MYLDWSSFFFCCCFYIIFNQQLYVGCSCLFGLSFTFTEPEHIFDWILLFICTYVFLVTCGWSRVFCLSFLICMSVCFVHFEIIWRYLDQWNLIFGLFNRVLLRSNRKSEDKGKLIVNWIFTNNYLIFCWFNYFYCRLTCQNEINCSISINYYYGSLLIWHLILITHFFFI